MPLHPARRTNNHKRRIKETRDPAELDHLARQVRYTGNPVHKRNPGDFHLNPSAQPRDDKTLCDNAGIFTRAEALRLLREGVKRGLISAQKRGAFPQNIWAVTDDDYPLEAQLENRVQGTYHGYPLSQNDYLASQILEHWQRYGQSL